MKIKIIANKPSHGDQESIQHLIGREYEVIHKLYDENAKFDGRVHVEDEQFGGLIIINPEEYENVS